MKKDLNFTFLQLDGFIIQNKEVMRIKLFSSDPPKFLKGGEVCPRF